jgi:hypothetical protein
VKVTLPMKENDVPRRRVIVWVTSCEKYILQFVVTLRVARLSYSSIPVNTGYRVYHFTDPTVLRLGASGPRRLYCNAL